VSALPFRLLCVAALSAAVAFGVTAARWSHAAPSVPVPIVSALLSPDGRSVTVAQTGQCIGAGALRARASASAVTLALTLIPHTGSCLGGVQQAAWTVRLAAALGERRLLDADGGREVPVFLAADLRRPALLPPGYRYAYAAPGYAVGAAAAQEWDPAVSQLFLSRDGARLWLVQEYGRHWPPGWTARADLVATHGHLARIGPGGIAWQQAEPQGTGPWMSFVLLARPALPLLRLLAVADSLPQ
jgi:hypothetical protein